MAVANSPERCPKCGGGMEQGFVFDQAHHSRIVSHWAPGAPLTSFWDGLKVPHKTLVPIGTYRCAACGFLEQYARPEFAAKHV